jgi:hypothetical protein
MRQNARYGQGLSRSFVCEDHPHTTHARPPLPVSILQALHVPLLGGCQTVERRKDSRGALAIQPLEIALSRAREGDAPLHRPNSALIAS